MRYRVLLGAVAGLVVVALGAGVAVSAPPGDGFTRHTAIEASGSLPVTRTIDSTNAPHSIGRNTCGSSERDSHVVWFKWTATTGPGPIDADTVGSSYDTVLYLFNPGGKLIGCNDDAFGALTSFVQFRSVVGKTYYFAVAAYDDTAGGDTHLNINLE
jgi:hypothetical protein